MSKQKVEIPDGLTTAEIHQQYEISRTTAWRASKRGWFWQGYHGDQSSPAVKEAVLQKFKMIVQLNSVNTSQFVSLKKQKIWDIVKDQSTLREDDWQRFKTEWTQVRNLLRDFLQARDHDYKVKKLRAIYHDAHIKPHILLENKNMCMRLQKGLNVYDYEIRSAHEKIDRLMSKTVV